jgi:acetolactate synthase-1/2/3 large subunit
MDVQSAAVDTELMAPEMSRAGSRPCAEPEYIEQAVKLMRGAKRPVILIGGGAMRAKAGEAIVKLAEQWGAAMVTTLAAKGTVRETHPQYAFHTGSKGTPVGLKVCRDADVVLALGTRFADETTCSYRKGVAFNFPDTKLIHVDIDAAEIGKNYGADVGIIADVNDAIMKLSEGLGKCMEKAEYLKEIVKLRGEWADYLKKVRAADAGAVTISQLIGKLNEILPKNTIIATSSGNTQAQLFQEYCYPEPYCNLTTGGFSTMGWAVPAAMGAKLAAPERPVIALLGDGDFMMIMQELSTMAQYDIPVVIVMVNNSGWMAIKDLQADVLGTDKTFGNDFMKGTEVYSPKFAEIAKCFGIDAVHLTELSDVEAAVKRALALNKPAFINIEVSRDYPYTGGKAFGWWDVPIPEYDKERREKYVAGKKQETI